jgi:hypothetical protein
MDGLYNFTVQEPIFWEHLQKLDDEELSREARFALSANCLPTRWRARHSMSSLR